MSTFYFCRARILFSKRKRSARIIYFTEITLTFIPVTPNKIYNKYSRKVLAPADEKIWWCLRNYLADFETYYTWTNQKKNKNVGNFLSIISVFYCFAKCHVCHFLCRLLCQLSSLNFHQTKYPFHWLRILQFWHFSYLWLQLSFVLPISCPRLPVYTTLANSPVQLSTTLQYLQWDISVDLPNFLSKILFKYLPKSLFPIFIFYSTETSPAHHIV